MKFPADWATIFTGLAVAVPFATAAIIAMRHGLRAPTTVYGHHAESRRRTRAAIESDGVLPELAALIVRVNSRAVRDGLDLEGADTERIADTLASVGYLQSLGRLSDLYGDYSDLGRYELDIVASARIGGLAAAVFLLAFVADISWLALNGLSLQWQTIAPTGLALVACVVWATNWVQQTVLQNRLTRLYRKYE